MNTTKGVQAVFHQASAPTGEQLQALLLRISRRIGRYLEKCDWLTREAERVSLALEPGDEEAASLDRLRACSIAFASDPERTGKAPGGAVALLEATGTCGRGDRI